MQKKQSQYLNPGQAYALALNCKSNTIVAGRGFGKGLICACLAKRNVDYMPGSNTGVVGPSAKRLYTNVIPSWDEHFRKWGYKPDVHYTWGKKPAKAWGWKEPIISPMNWENTLSFYNGTVFTLISQDRKGTSNSKSFDYLLIDEAKFVDFEQYKDETLPALRGNGNVFGHLYFHGGISKFSDMPTTKKGSWFLNDREKCDPANVQLLEGLIASYTQLQQEVNQMVAQGNRPDANTVYRLRRLSKVINQLRADTLLYKEFSSIENIEILGEDFVRQCKRDMPKATFRTTIMCKRVTHSEDSFYNAKTDANLYKASNNSYIDSIGFNMEKLRHVDCRFDGDIDWTAPLWISFDANANINWLVVGQPGKDMKLRILKSFFEKYERRLPELVDDFCDYYEPLKCHEVVFCYDSTFIGNDYGRSAEGFADTIKYCLMKRGWTVQEVYIGNPWRHPVKQSLINRMFNGADTHYKILFNEENNPDLLISIDDSKSVNGTNQKDKSKEKGDETEESPLESRTDGGDAFDTLCIAVEAGPVPSYVGGGDAGVV